jgi:RNA polymerase sigma-70 factor (ECF subfamily)
MRVVSIGLDPTKQASFDEDTILVERFLANEPGSFEALYSKYYDKVLAIARGVLMDSDEAADAVQEVFTLVYRHLHRFNRQSRFSTWLFRIAVNRSIQEARRNRHRHKNVELSEALSTEAPSESQDVDPRVQSALAGMQPADRALLVLFYWEELSLQEIGDSIGCGVNAAKTRLYRARERFRVLYEREEEDSL